MEGERIMSEIRAFHSHIEIYPYTKGQSEKIEKFLSKYDTNTHKYIPIGYYIERGVLYLPRGINLSMLQHEFGTIPTIVNTCDKNEKISTKIKMLFEPRDRIQEESIDFLTSKNQFAKGNSCSQFGLNLDTGDGKTYCMIHGIANLNMKAIIITHKSRLKSQWKEEFLTKTNIDENRIIDISGGQVIDKIMNDKLEGDIYLVNHQTLYSYARISDASFNCSPEDLERLQLLREDYASTGEEKYAKEITKIEKKYGITGDSYDWSRIREFFKKIAVGVKVIDEAHKFFENTLMLDFFSNVKRSYYLTATFTRSDPKEVRIFERAFSNLYRFGEETLNYEEKRKHIVFVVVYYHSYPSLVEKRSVSTSYGFSAYKFIDYALKESNDSLMKVLYRILDSSDRLKGKTLVVSPKKESVDYIANKIRENTDKSVGSVHSSYSKAENDESIKCDIISSTIKSIGEGDNIKGLRKLINLEPVGSKALADQLRGRLREYSDTDDTFLFYPVDMAITETYEFLKRIMPVMKKKCKQIVFMRMDDI